MGGTCEGSQSGVSGADALCEARASSAGLPSGFSYDHRAMLSRSGTHPRDLSDIPNKEREVKRPDGTLIVAHYDMAGADNDYWDDSTRTGFTIPNTVGGRAEAARSDFTVFYYWAGLSVSGFLETGVNCSDWTTAGAGAIATHGSVANDDTDRHQSDPPVNCALSEYTGPKTSFGVLCASY